MVARGRLRDGDDRRGARRVRNVWIRRHVITADLGVAAGVDQIDVEQAVAGVIWIEREAEQPALPVRQDLAGYVEERRCQNLSGIEIEDFDQPGFLDDEQPTGIAGRRDGENGLVETRCHPGRGDCAGVALRSVGVMYGRRPRCKRNLTISEAFGCGHVWTAPAVQEESDYQRSVRVRSCIRPLSAAVWPLALM